MTARPHRQAAAPEEDEVEAAFRRARESVAKALARPRVKEAIRKQRDAVDAEKAKATVKRA